MNPDDLAMMGLTMEQFLQLPPQEQQRIQMEMQQSQPAPQQGGGMNPAMALQFLPKAGAAASGGGAAAAPSPLVEPLVRVLLVVRLVVRLAVERLAAVACWRRLAHGLPWLR